MQTESEPKEKSELSESLKPFFWLVLLLLFPALNGLKKSLETKSVVFIDRKDGQPFKPGNHGYRLGKVRIVNLGTSKNATTRQKNCRWPGKE